MSCPRPRTRLSCRSPDTRPSRERSACRSIPVRRLRLDDVQVPEAEIPQPFHEVMDQLGIGVGRAIPFVVGEHEVRLDDDGEVLPSLPGVLPLGLQNRVEARFPRTRFSAANLSASRMLATVAFRSVPTGSRRSSDMSSSSARQRCPRGRGPPRSGAGISPWESGRCSPRAPVRRASGEAYPFCLVSGCGERGDSQFIPFHPHLAGTRPGDDGSKEGLQSVADPVLAFIPKCP